MGSWALVPDPVWDGVPGAAKAPRLACHAPEGEAVLGAPAGELQPEVHKFNAHPCAGIVVLELTTDHIRTNIYSGWHRDKSSPSCSGGHEIKSRLAWETYISAAGPGCFLCNQLQYWLDIARTLYIEHTVIYSVFLWNPPVLFCCPEMKAI